MWQTALDASRSERLFKVGNDVINVLDANRDTNEILLPVSSWIFADTYEQVIIIY